MSVEVGAFGWHATVFVEWPSLAILAAVMIAIALLVKMLIARAG